MFIEEDVGFARKPGQLSCDSCHFITQLVSIVSTTVGFNRGFGRGFGLSFVGNVVCCKAFCLTTATHIICCNEGSVAGRAMPLATPHLAILAVSIVVGDSSQLCGPRIHWMIALLVLFSYD
jgi:hypothetical protein